MSRQRFFFNLGALGAAVLMITASVAFGAEAVKGVGLGIGAGGCLFSVLFVATLMHSRRPAGHPELWLFGHGLSLWSALGGVMAGVATWE